MCVWETGLFFKQYLDRSDLPRTSEVFSRECRQIGIPVGRREADEEDDEGESLVSFPSKILNLNTTRTDFVQ